MSSAQQAISQNPMTEADSTAPRRRWHLAVLAGAILLASGCAVGPDYEAPLEEQPGQTQFHSMQDELFSGDTLGRHWWRLYDTPELDALIQEALEENADLRIAAANLSRSQALLSESRSGRLPSAEVSATQNRSRQNVFFEQPISFTNNTSSADLSIDYQVDLFGRVRRSIEAAQASAEAQQAAYHATQITVVAETVRAYAEACAFGYQVDVAEESLDLQAQTSRLTEELREAGRGTAFEVASAASQVAQTRAMIPSLRTARQSALYRLAVLLGREPGNYPDAAAQCSEPLSLDQEIPVGDGAQLLSRRPDVRQAERELAAATAQVGVATAQLYPNISLSGAIGSAALIGEEPSLFSSETETWSYGSMISWAFPNITGKLARKDQAEADVDAALARFEGAWLDALRETETALTAYAQELERYESLKTARDHSAEAARLAQARFEAGRINFLDVLRVQLNRTNAEIELADSRSRLAGLQVDLFLALGGGWQSPELAENEAQ